MAPVDSHVLTAANTTTLNTTTKTYTSNILARAALPTIVPCSGCMDPSKVNNKAFFALFALLGVACVLTSIWFFFWAKNGGFQFRPGDWEDYKTTVLRRKGPDGKTIYSGSRGTRYSTYNKSDRIAAKSVVGYDEKGRKGVRSQRGFGGSHSIYYSDDFTIFSGSRADDMSEVMTEKGNNSRRPHTRGGHQEQDLGHSRRYRDRDLREYKQEKPARVGGINRSADGTQYDYSDRSETMTELTDRSTAPLNPSNNASNDRKRAKAEKKAVEDAARMERKWRKDAERAAAALARENAASTSAPAPRNKKSAAPAKESVPRSSHRRRQESRSRSSSPKKSASKPARRDYSFSGGPDEVSTVYSGSQTVTSGTQSSYYDAYRPVAQNSPSGARQAGSRNSSASPSKQRRSSRYESEGGSSRGYESGRGYERRERQKPKGGRDVMAGYRRGMDSLASDSE